MIFFRLDSQLLRCIESIAHAFQRLTGMNNSWLGWSMFYLLVVEQNYELLSNNFTLTVFIIVNMLSALGFLIVYFVVKRYSTSNTDSGTRSRNGMEIAQEVKLLRLWFVFFFVLELTNGSSSYGKAMNDIKNLEILLMWYFLSCTPLPPGKSTISKLIESGLSFSTSTRQEQPV